MVRLKLLPLPTLRAMSLEGAASMLLSAQTIEETVTNAQYCWCGWYQNALPGQLFRAVPFVVKIS